MQQTLSWGVIGTGGIATDFTQALVGSSRCRVVNVVGTSPAKAKAFAERWSLPRSSASLDDLLSDPEVQAVYVASPHPAHEAQALACIEAGKHVLCEKPICVDLAGAQRVIGAARRGNVFLMEAFMYRCHPMMQKLTQRLKEGCIGTLRHLRADFGFRVDRDPEHRLYKPALGGGAILDVGGYPASLSRLIAGIIEGAPFAEPTQIAAAGALGPHGADELATALLTFSSGFTAQLSCAVYHDLGTAATLFGDEGKITIADPWIPQGQRQSLATEFTIERYGIDPEVIKVTTDKPTYAIEAELVADSLPRLEAPWPAMSWHDTLGNMRVLDAWRRGVESGRIDQSQAEEP